MASISLNLGRWPDSAAQSLKKSKSPYELGRQAHAHSQLAQNQYPAESDAAREWERGYDDAATTYSL